MRTATCRHWVERWEKSAWCWVAEIELILAWFFSFVGHGFLGFQIPELVFEETRTRQNPKGLCSPRFRIPKSSTERCAGKWNIVCTCITLNQCKESKLVLVSMESVCNCLYFFQLLSHFGGRLISCIPSCRNGLKVLSLAVFQNQPVSHLQSWATELSAGPLLSHSWVCPGGGAEQGSWLTWWKRLLPLGFCLLRRDFQTDKLQYRSTQIVCALGTYRVGSSSVFPTVNDLSPFFFFFSFLKCVPLSVEEEWWCLH